MSLKLLRQIAASRLPVLFYRPEDIDKVRTLCSAGLVIAMVPDARGPLDFSAKAAAAQVLAVTHKGLEELAAFSYPTAARPASKPWLSTRIADFVSGRNAQQQNHRQAP
ncbi:hypothetical protein [Variovorax sp. JS1663]|uniref:hypothetical protein n=1 Tax=Variovorax sp. JS1663 TaxID=1851577 RepID=UPI000B349E56|nr:hypothetical protein [Variovorax sp. JS1663]OUM03729.1 hypothetical protein A8M77_04245 [Variovorax sp. JS1663]